MTYRSFSQAVRPFIALIICLNLLVSAALKSQGASASLDQSFAIGIGSGFPSDPEGNFWPQIQAVAVQPDGKVIAGGQSLFRNFNGTPVRALVRINVDGTLDAAFQANLGTGPTVTTNPGEVNRIIVQPDGKILICGDFNSVNGFSRNSIARLNADGSVDTEFIASGGGVGGASVRYLEDMALQSNGKILIGGGFSSYLGTARWALARLNNDGTLDATFNHGFPSGLGTSTVIRSLGVQADGKIYVGGTFSNWLGLATPGIVRLNSNGTLDNSFLPQHTNPYASVQALHVTGDGKVLVGGFIEGTASGITRNLARLNQDGSLDNSFPVGTGVKGWVADIQPWPEGGYLVAGRFREVSGQPRGQLALIDAAGNVDLSFNPQPYPDPLTDLVHIYSTAVAPDGKIIFGGWLTNYPNNTLLNGQTYAGLGRLIGGFTGGAGKIQFTTPSLFVNEEAGTVTVSVSRFGGLSGAVGISYATASGSATAGSDFSTTGGTLSWANGEAGIKSFTVPISSDAAAEGLETFSVNLSSASGGATIGAIPSVTVTIVDDDSVPTITTHPQDTSAFLTYSGTFRVSVGPGLPVTYQWRSNEVAILNATNPVLTLFNVQTNFQATYSVVVSNSIGATISDEANLTVVIPAGLTDPNFVTPGVGFNGDVYGLGFQADGKLIVAGTFSQYGGVSIPNNIARLNADGSRDSEFPATLVGANSVIQSLTAAPDGKWLITGNFTQYSGTERRRLARLNADGSLDLTFSNTVVSGSVVYTAVPQTNGGVLIGDANFVRRYLPSGTNDTNFVNAALIGQVYALLELPDGKILASSHRNSAPSGSELFRLNPDGTRDLSYKSPGRFTGQISQMSLMPDGRIFLTGAFLSVQTETGPIPLGYMAMLNEDGQIDVTFPAGLGNSSNIRHVVQPDGRIVIGGAATFWNEEAVGYFLRITPNGERDFDFLTGTGANNYVRAIAMDSLGRFAIGGAFTQVNSQSRGKVALLTSGAGSIQFDSAQQIVTEHGGSVTISVERVAGSRGAVSVDYNTVSGTAIAGTDFTAATGTLSWADGEAGVKTFQVTLNNDGLEEADENFSVELSNLIGDAPYGLFTNHVVEILDANSPPRFTLEPVATISPEDVPATFTSSAFSALPFTYQWRSNNIVIVNATNASLTLLNVQSNFVAPYSVTISNANGFITSSNAALTVIPSPTRRDTSFVATPAFNGAVRAIVPLGDGRVMVGGDFTAPRNKIVLLNSDGVVDLSFTNTVGTGTAIYDIERDHQGRWLIAGQFSQFAGVTASNLVRLNADYSVDLSFLTALGASPNGLVRDVTVGPNGKIWIGGDFSSVGGPFGLQNLARLNPNGSPDLNFLPKAGNPVYRIVPLPTGGALIGGNFSSYDGFGGYLRRVYPDGTVDRTYSPSVPGSVYDIVPLPDGGVVVAGNFNNPSSRLLKFSAAGTRDTSFLDSVTTSHAMNSAVLQSNGKIAAVGNFTTSGAHSNRFTRVNVDGTQDNSIFIGAGFNGEAHRIALEHTGHLWVGGAFTQYKGASPGYLVRLIGDAPTVSIGTQPFDRVVSPGQNTTFTVTASGSGTLSYQWTKNDAPLANGGIVSGANTASLTLTGISVGDEGSYSVIVSNSDDLSATSRSAVLKVKSAPQILAQPSDASVPVGGRLFLAAEVEGAPTLGYQWFKDGALVGGNMPVLAVTNSTPGASGNYQLVASNSFGFATSEVASVTVQMTPATVASGFFTDAGTGNAFDTFYALQPLPDGQLMAGGSFSNIRTNGANNISRQNLALFTTNGMADPFNPGAGSQITDVVRQRDGKILVAGYFTTISSVSRRYIARYNADLTFDTNFHNAIGLGPDQRVEDIALQSDGKILLAGNFSNVSGKAGTRGVARLNPDGSVDESFVSGYPQFSGATLVDVLPDGKILLSGGNYGGHAASVYRVFPNGSVDVTFTNSLPSVTALAVQTNGAIVVGGTFTTANGENRPLIARLVGNGQLDTNFFAPTNFAGYNQPLIRSIAIQDNGKILAGGNFLTFGPFRNGLARFNPDGSPDESFIFQQGIGDDSNANIWKISLFADGRIAVGGRFTTWEGVAENNFAILSGDPVALGFASQPVDQFVPAGTTVQFNAQTVGTSAISYQWFRGATPLSDVGNISGTTSNTLTITGVSQADVAFYSLRITNDSGVRTSLPAELFILAAPIFTEQPSGGLYFTSNSISLRATVLGVAPITYQWLVNSNVIASATNSSLLFTNLALTNAGNYQLVASNSLGVATSVVASITVLNPPAAISGTWPHPAGVNNSVYTVAPLGDGRVVIGGEFTFAGSTGNETARANIALLNTNGTVDATFNPAPDGRVQVIRRDSAGRFLVGGWFNNIGGGAANYFARLNSDGSLDTNFVANLGTGPFGFVYEIALQSDGKILVGGQFTTVNGQSYPGVVRLNDNGTIDGSFRMNAQFPQIQSIVPLASGKIYVGGVFYMGDRTSIARLESSGAVDLTFNATANGSVNRIISLNDGVLLGGSFSLVNNSSAQYVARLNLAGELDLNWPQARPNQAVNDIIRQANGKVIAVGSFNTVGVTRDRIVRYNADGSLDVTFAPATGFGFNTPRVLALESDGRIWVGGSLGIYEGVSVKNIVLITGDPVAPGSGSPFENWAASAGLTPGNDSPGDDADNDSVANVFEYYFGTSPTNAASSDTTFGASVVVGGATYPAITFVRVKDIEGVTLLPQASSNVNFSDSLGTTVESVVDIGNGLEEVTIRSSLSDAVHPTQFLRIQLSVP